MTKPFNFTDAAEIAAAPYIARAERGERTQAAAHRAQVESFAGKSFYVEPRDAKAPEQIKAEGVAAYRKAIAFAESPRGRFLTALRELQNLGYADEADKARACMSRGFADERWPAYAAELGYAIATLERVNHLAARAAVLALAEILTAGALRSVA